MVMVGADAGALRALSKQMNSSAARLDDIVASLGSAVNHSPWSGIDAIRFSSDWGQSLRPILARVAQTLQVGAEDLRRNAEEQEQASAAFAAPSPGGGVTMIQTRGIDEIFTVPEWFGADRKQPWGKLSDQITDRWKAMTDAEREKWLRNYVEALADEKGLDRPTVRFYDEDTPSMVAASWCEKKGEHGCTTSRTLNINREILDDPYSINTVAHELRHVEQFEMIRRMDEG
ncbi:MAG: hypothetical protein GX875_08815, partial [Propionibacterium sp.]|nr:hypothetical protein [Propionibacterium sp.]